MQRCFTCLLALLTLSTVAAAQESADVVELRNGDRITGTVSAITADGVVIQSAALGADPVTVAMGEIASVTTASMVKLETADGERLDVVVQGLDGQRLRVGQGDQARDLPLESLVEVLDTSWTGSFNLGASVSSGNTERRSVSAGAQAIRRSRVDRIRLRSNWDYAEERSTITDSTGNEIRDWRLTQRRLFGDAKYDYFFADDLYGLASVSAENDGIADLNLRLIAGAGLGYQWYEEADFALSTEAGLTFISEDRPTDRSVAPPVESDAEYVAARIAISLSWELADDTQLLSDAEVYPSLEDPDDLYARVDTRLRTTLTDNLFAQLQWIFDYDNTPARGFDRQDHRLLLSIGYSF